MPSSSFAYISLMGGGRGGKEMGGGESLKGIGWLCLFCFVLWYRRAWVVGVGWDGMEWIGSGGGMMVA